MLFNSFGREDTVTESMSVEDQSLILESLMLESLTEEELTAFLESHSEVNAAINDEILVEKTIVRLDKKAKISQAQKTAVFTIARQKNDPKIKKLMTVWRIERALEADLFRKYGSEALRRAKQAVNNAARSSSKTVRTLGTRATTVFSGGPAPKKRK